jgi:uncharacterized protein
MAWWKRRGRGDGGLDPAVAAEVRAAYRTGAPLSEAIARRAAEAGSREGMTVYGIALGNRGAFAEAELWLKRAIDSGDSRAAIALGCMHMNLGDFDRAEQCFHLAAGAGHPSAGPALGELRNRRRGSEVLAAHLSPREAAPRYHPEPPREPPDSGLSRRFRFHGASALRGAKTRATRADPP